jgi:hypothetical protein
MLAMPRILPEVIYAPLGRNLGQDTLLNGREDDDGKGRSVFECIEKGSGVLVVGRHILDDTLTETDEVGEAERVSMSSRESKGASAE